jgi:hypothetical protein
MAVKKTVWIEEKFIISQAELVEKLKQLKPDPAIKPVEHTESIQT